jgi:hypothetical protein
LEKLAYVTQSGSRRENTDSFLNTFLNWWHKTSEKVNAKLGEDLKIKSQTESLISTIQSF